SPVEREGLSRAESIVISLVGALAIAVLAAYLPYRFEWTVRPALVLVVSIAAFVALIALLKPSRSVRVEREGSSRAILDSDLPIGGIAGGIFFWCLWKARPDFLPVGGGPDLTHHLVLINYIERHWNLIFDP